MNKTAFRTLFAAAALMSGLAASAAPPASGKEPAAKETADVKDQAALEAQLSAARQRLDSAAREVAQLSGQLNEPMTRKFVNGRSFRQRAMIGVGLSDDPANQNKEGAVVESVTPGGPASAAGIKAGDVLVSVAGETLKNAKPSPNRALVGKLHSVKPGDKLKIEYLRDGKTRTVEVKTEAADFERYAAVRGWAGAPGLGFNPGNRVFMAQTRPFPPGLAAGVTGVPGHTAAFSGFMGPNVFDMELVTLTPKLGRYFGSDRGVLVVRGPRDSSLKLEEGDVIVDIDGRAPQSGAHAMRILRSYQPGEKIEFNVLREKKKVQLAVEMPRNQELGDVLRFRNPGMGFEAPEIEFKAAEPLEAPLPPPPSPPASPAEAM